MEEGQIKKLTVALTIKIILFWRSSMRVQRTRGRRHFGSAVNLGAGNIDDETSKTGKLLFREELGKVVCDIMFRRTPEAPYPRGFSVVANSVAYSEVAKLNMLRLL